jgi:hypothetical protein
MIRHLGVAMIGPAGIVLAPRHRGLDLHARITTLQMDPRRVDVVAERLRREDIPGFEELEGFKR